MREEDSQFVLQQNPKTSELILAQRDEILQHLLLMLRLSPEFANSIF